MTNQEKLKIVIERGIKGGYEMPNFGREEIILGYIKGCKEELYIGLADGVSYEAIIFDHDFAKSYWGETLRHESCYSLSKGGLCDCHPEVLWQYHLQACVLSPDPIDYYYTNYKG